MFFHSIILRFGIAHNTNGTRQNFPIKTWSREVETKAPTKPIRELDAGSAYQRNKIAGTRSREVEGKILYPTNSWIGCRLSLLRVQPASLKRFDGFVVEMLDDLDRQLDAVLVVGQRSKAVVGVDVTNRNTDDDDRYTAVGGVDRAAVGAAAGDS